MSHTDKSNKIVKLTNFYKIEKDIYKNKNKRFIFFTKVSLFILSLRLVLVGSSLIPKGNADINNIP